MEELFNNEDKNALAGFIDLVLTATERLPFVAPAVGVYNAFKKFQDDDFSQKLKSYLEGERNEKERRDLIKMSEKDPKKFLDFLIIVFKELDKSEKSTIIGNLFNALNNGRIKSSDFKTLFAKVNDLDIDSIKYLDFEFRSSLVHLPIELRIPFDKNDKRYYLSHCEEEEYCHPLIVAGLVKRNVELVKDRIRQSVMGYDNGVMKEKISYESTRLGRTLILYGILNRDGYPYQL